MGRRENPIASCDRELEKLVRCLRDQRVRAGLNYKQLATRSGCSASTLIRAASGEQVPKLKTVRAYAVACGTDPGEVERRRKRARYRAVRACEGPVPHPDTYGTSRNCAPRWSTSIRRTVPGRTGNWKPPALESWPMPPSGGFFARKAGAPPSSSSSRSPTPVG
ncbi:helix-turn-helix domain-containing protein [Streptomyces sp. NPDC004296]|uniref:helix-turn-helix domain-containing protein n=1 Tax=Streptomyces sp. NPDC004296 TaxID=3364697 RepID=UPI0036796CA7